MFRNAIHTSYKTHCASVTKTRWSLLFWEIIFYVIVDGTLKKKTF